MTPTTNFGTTKSLRWPYWLVATYSYSEYSIQKCVIHRPLVTRERPCTVETRVGFALLVHKMLLFRNQVQNHVLLETLCLFGTTVFNPWPAAVSLRFRGPEVKQLITAGDLPSTRKITQVRLPLILISSHILWPHSQLVGAHLAGGCEVSRNPSIPWCFRVIFGF